MPYIRHFFYFLFPFSFTCKDCTYYFFFFWYVSKETSELVTAIIHIECSRARRQRRTWHVPGSTCDCFTLNYNLHSAMYNKPITTCHLTLTCPRLIVTVLVDFDSLTRHHSKTKPLHSLSLLPKKTEKKTTPTNTTLKHKPPKKS